MYTGDFSPGQEAPASLPTSTTTSREPPFLPFSSAVENMLEGTSTAVKQFLDIQRHFYNLSLKEPTEKPHTTVVSSPVCKDSFSQDFSSLSSFAANFSGFTASSPALPVSSPKDETISPSFSLASSIDTTTSSPPLTAEQLSEQLRLHVLAHRYIRQGMVPPADILRRIFFLMDPSLCEHFVKKYSIIKALQNPLEGTLINNPEEQLRDRLRLLDLLSNPDLYEVLSRFIYLPEETLNKIATERKLLNCRDFQKSVRLKVMEKCGKLGRPLQHDFLCPDSALSFSDISSLLPLDFCNYILWDRLNPLVLKTGQVVDPSKQFYPEAIRVSAVQYVFQQRENLNTKFPFLAENGMKLKAMRLKLAVPQKCMAMRELWKERRMCAQRVASAASAHISSVELKKQQLREKQQRERMRLLKDNDIVKYMEMVKQTKNKRLHELLESTEVFLKDMGSRVSLQKVSSDTSNLPSQDPVAQENALTKWKMISTHPKETFDEKKSIGEKYYKLSHEITEKITQPSTLVGGILMPYQLSGLEWLVSLFNNNLHGILADEMGLGKTIQTIALFAYLKEFKNCRGPHLVIVPLSTIPNWASEFQKWCPSINIMQFRGGRLERKLLIKDLRRTNFDVCLTTFDFIIREKGPLSSPSWRYIIVDEGHRMKNVKSKFHTTLNDFRSSHRLLLTGTPLQNNLTELWSLLNFLLPKIFSSSEDFEKWFSEPFQGTGLADTGQTIECLNEEEQMLIINRLHSVLRPFLLRRVKTDVLEDLPDKLEFTVHVELSAWQKAYYKQIQERAFRTVDAAGNVAKKSFQNTLMQLRKIVNHPYLFLDEYLINDDLYRVAGKFEVLDRMLPKFLYFKHKILIFAQMTQLMDILGDYLTFKEIKYHRLDGAIGLQERKERMDFFNDPEDDTLVFMLSTRAGGLGLNLQAADTVILFDSDFNPHQDLQATCRAHRVGQQNEVRVFRLITISGVEELILTKAQHKLNIDEKVIQAGMFNTGSTDEDREERLRRILGGKFSKMVSEATTPQELNRYMARTEAEEEWFESYDRQLFGAQMERFCLNETSTASETTTTTLPAISTKHGVSAFSSAATSENGPACHPKVFSLQHKEDNTVAQVEAGRGVARGYAEMKEDRTQLRDNRKADSHPAIAFTEPRSSSPSLDSRPASESIPPSSLTSLDELPPPVLVTARVHSTSLLPSQDSPGEANGGGLSTVSTSPPLHFPPTEGSPVEHASSEVSMAASSSSRPNSTPTLPEEGPTVAVPYDETHTDLGEDGASPVLSSSETGAAALTVTQVASTLRKRKRGRRGAVAHTEHSPAPVEEAEWIDWRRSGKIASVLISCGRLMHVEDLPPWIVVDDEETPSPSDDHLKSRYDETLVATAAGQTGLLTRTGSGSSLSSLPKTGRRTQAYTAKQVALLPGEANARGGGAVRILGRGRGRGMRFALEHSARRLRARRENRVMYNDTLTEAKFLRVVERLGAGDGTNLEEALREEMQRAQARKEKRGLKRRLKELRAHREELGVDGSTIVDASAAFPEEGEGDALKKRKRRSWTRRLRPQTTFPGRGRPHRGRGRGRSLFRIDTVRTLPSGSTERSPLTSASPSGMQEKDATSLGVPHPSPPPPEGRRRSGRPRLHRPSLPLLSTRTGISSPPVDEEVEEMKEMRKPGDLVESTALPDITEADGFSVKRRGFALRLGRRTSFRGGGHVRGRARGSMRGLRRVSTLRRRSTRFSLNTARLVNKTDEAVTVSIETKPSDIKPLARLTKKRNLDSEEETPGTSNRYVGELDFDSPNYSSAGESSDVDEKQKLSSSLLQKHARKGSRESSSPDEEKSQMARNHRKVPRLRGTQGRDNENDVSTSFKAHPLNLEKVASKNVSSAASHLSFEGNISTEEVTSYSANELFFPSLSISKTSVPSFSNDSNFSLFPEEATTLHTLSDKDALGKNENALKNSTIVTSRSPSVDPVLAHTTLNTGSVTTRVEVPKYVPPDSSNATLRWGKRGSKPHGICLLDESSLPAPALDKPD